MTAGRRPVQAAADRDSREEAQRLFGDLLESLPDAMIVTAVDGTIALVNGQAESLFGYDRNELVGRPVEILIPAEHRDRHREHRHDFVASPQVRPMGVGLSLAGRKRSGVEFPVEISLAPLHSDAGLLVAAAVRDITTRRDAEALVVQALERERKVTERLRELDRLKDEFLSTVSHELRTPLTAIVGFAELLSVSGDLDPARRTYLLQRIVANATDMAGMVEQLLDYSRLQAARVTLHLEPLTLDDLVARSISALSGVLGQHRLETSAHLPAPIMADAAAIERVLTNLLSNAAKFSPDGTVIRVRARVHGAEAVVEVADEGPGVDPADQARIFERFFQGIPAVVGKRGTGLGLSVARQYVQMMGGRIWVSSEPGRGATFSVSVPLALTVPRDVTQLPTVLIVDDEPDIVDLVDRHLVGAGYRCVHARSGEEALELLERTEFDAVLLDLRLPGIDGIEVLQRLRADRRLPALPVVAFTASADRELAQRARELGCRRQVNKPFRASELLEALEAVVG